MRASGAFVLAGALVALICYCNEQRTGAPWPLLCPPSQQPTHNTRSATHAPKSEHMTTLQKLQGTIAQSHHEVFHCLPFCLWAH